MTTPYQPLGGKLRKAFNDPENELIVDASEVKILSRTGNSLIPDTANSLEDALNALEHSGLTCLGRENEIPVGIEVLTANSINKVVVGNSNRTFTIAQNFGAINDVVAVLVNTNGSDHTLTLNWALPAGGIDYPNSVILNDKDIIYLKKCPGPSEASEAGWVAYSVIRYKGGTGGSSNVFDQDRIIIGDPDANSAQPGYIIFKNAFVNDQGNLADGRLVYSSAGSENPGSLQIYNSQGEHTVLTDVSNDDQFPSFLARTSDIPEAGGARLSGRRAYNITSTTPQNLVAADVGKYICLGVSINGASFNLDNSVGEDGDEIAIFFDDARFQRSISITGGLLCDGTSHTETLTHNQGIHAVKLDTHWLYLTFFREQQDISGIATNTTAIAANTTAIAKNTADIDALEARPQFQLDSSLTQWDAGLRSVTETSEPLYKQGFDKAVQLHFSTPTDRSTGALKAGGDNTGIAYSGNNLTGLPSTPSTGDILGVEFSGPVNRGTNLSGYGNYGVVLQDTEGNVVTEQTVNIIFMQDRNNRYGILKPSANNVIQTISDANFNAFRAEGGPVGNTYDLNFVPADGDIALVQYETVGTHSIAFQPIYFDKSDTRKSPNGSWYWCNRIVFDGVADNVNYQDLFDISNLHIHSEGRIRDLFYFHHEGYEPHDTLIDVLRNHEDEDFLHVKYTNSDQFQSYAHQFEFEDQLKVPTKATVGTLQVGQTELTQAKLDDLLTALHIPEESVTRTVAHPGLEYAMVADDVDKYVAVSIQGAVGNTARLFLIDNDLGSNGDVMFIRNAGNRNFNVGHGNNVLATLEENEVVPFAKISGNWIPIVNFLTAQGGGLTQPQVDTRITSLVQQFARDTTTRLKKGKLPTETVYSDDAAFTGKANSTDVAILTSDLTGNGGKFPKVNAAGDDIEYVDAPSGGSGGSSDFEDVDITINRRQNSVTQNITSGRSLASTTLAGSDGIAINLGYGSITITDDLNRTEIITASELTNAATSTTAYFKQTTNYQYYKTELAGGSPTIKVVSRSSPRLVRAHYTTTSTVIIHDLTTLLDVQYDVPGAGDEIYDFQYVLNGVVQVAGRFDADQFRALSSVDDGAAFNTLTTSNSIRFNFYTEGDTTTRQRTFAIGKGTGNSFLIGDNEYSESRDGVPVLKLRRQTGGGGGSSTALYADDLLNLIDNSEGNVDAAVAGDTSKIKLTAASSFPTVVEAYAPSTNQMMAASDIGKYVALAPSADIRYTFNADRGANGDFIWLSNQTGIAGNDVAVYGGVGNNHLLITLKQNETMPFFKINNVWTPAFDLKDPEPASRSVVTPSPASTTLTLTEAQLDTWDTLWFYNAAVGTAADSIPITLDTAAMKAMSFTGNNEIRVSGNVRASWNHSTRTLTCPNTILFAVLKDRSVA